MLYSRMKYGNITYYLDGYFSKNTSLSDKSKDCLTVPKGILYRLLLLIDTGKIPYITQNRSIIVIEVLVIVD